MPLHVTEIEASIPLGHRKRFGMRMPAEVEPGRLLESDAVDNQSVAVPTGRRNSP